MSTKKKVIIANWKMSLSIKETEILARDILTGLEKMKVALEIVLCPSFPALLAVKKIIDRYPNLKTIVRLGAQNVFWEERGAYTGEVSIKMFKELGLDYVIIGHSERRIYLKEDEEMIHKKVRIVLDYNLIPIICVGEKFEERQLGQKDIVVIRQISSALEGINFDENDRIIFAYEPVWVIGSGQAVAPEEAEYTHQVIKQRLIDFLPTDFVKKKVQMVYGGSVDKNNVQDFMKKDNIDGVLVGGASLNAQEFITILSKISSR